MTNPPTSDPYETPAQVPGFASSPPAPPSDPMAEPAYPPYPAGPVYQDPYAAGGYHQPGHDLQPYGADGYQQPGYQQVGYPQPGYPQQGYPGQGPYPGGHPYPPQYGYAPATNGLAIASLVVSIISVAGLCAYGLGGYLGIAGLIMGVVARRQVREQGTDGDGLALAGLIIGAVATAIAVIATILFIIMIGSFAASGSGA
jgi:hypothetical protein